MLAGLGEAEAEGGVGELGSNETAAAVMIGHPVAGADVGALAGAERDDGCGLRGRRG